MGRWYLCPVGRRPRWWFSGASRLRGSGKNFVYERLLYAIMRYSDTLRGHVRRAAEHKSSSFLQEDSNPIGDKSRLFSVYWRLNSSVQSCLRCEHVCKQVLVVNWKLGRDKTKLCSHRISRLGKTVAQFSVTDSLDLSPILFRPPSLVLSSPCRWCELGIRVNVFFKLFSWTAA